MGIEEDDENKETSAYFLKCLELIIEKAIKQHSGKNILMTHHLLGSFQSAGSEQGLNLSGLESLPLSMFTSKFEYLALGHIHKPQFIKKANPIAYYSGSPIPLRFSETEEKSVSVLSWDKGELVQEILSIPSFRPLQTLKLTDDNYLNELAEFLERFPNLNALEGFLNIEIELQEARSNMADNIRTLLKDTNWKLVSFIPKLPNKRMNKNFNLDVSTMASTEKMFEIFYNEQFPDSKNIPTKIMKEFRELLEDVQVLEEGVQ